METKKLKQLKSLLIEFKDSNIFGMGEMEYFPIVDSCLQLVDGAIINNEDNKNE